MTFMKHEKEETALKNNNIGSSKESVTLSNAKFNGLTQIKIVSDCDLTGIIPDDIIVTLPNGEVVDTCDIRGISFNNGALTVDIDTSIFDRITSEGTSICVRPFGTRVPLDAIKIQRSGEMAEGGYILGASQWTDEGLSTSKTDLDFYDPVTGQAGLWRFTDTKPNQDINGNPMNWNNGNVTIPAQRLLNMLVLFIEFPDRLAMNAGDYEGVSYKNMKAYLEFIEGGAKWLHMSSYGQCKQKFVCPQADNNEGWIMMDKKSTEYPWNGQTHNMFAYIREACQHAYDNLGIRADDYDLLLIMPPRLSDKDDPKKSGLFNGPGNINRDPTDSKETNTNLVAYYDKESKPHYISTCVTAGNDMFKWGYRWVIHELGHAFGFPDTYTYDTTVAGERVGQFFWCGDWDMMGNIGGHSTDFFAWHKWKLGWIRDDQADVITKAGITTHRISPIETSGGSKMVVVRTGVSTAYVMEFRTKLGINALNNRGKYQGVLIYRLDASRWEQKDINYCMQVISKQYYNNPTVGGARNLTGIWRPIDNTVDGYNSSGCCWQPGDIFEDPANGIKIQVNGITNYLDFNPDESQYTANDNATITVTKTGDTASHYPVVLSNAKLDNLTKLTFDTNIELQRRIKDSNSINNGHYTYIREESVLTAADLIIKKTGGSIIPADKITGITINSNSVEVTLAEGVFQSKDDAKGLTIATRPFYYFAASEAIKLNTLPATVVKDGMTQPVYDAAKSIYETVFVEVPCDTDNDGKRDLVEVLIRRPLETNRGMKVPVIYEINPYLNKVSDSPNHDVIVEQKINPDKSSRTYEDVRYKGMSAADWDPDAAGVPKARISIGISDEGTNREPFNTGWYTYFISRGYAVIYSGSLGNLNSEGLEICGGVEDALVAKTVIEWLNGKAKAYTNKTDNIEVVPKWCNGNVAMSGVSYPGTLPIAAACTGVEGLKTIIPVCGISSWYDSYRYGGAVIAPYGNQGEDVDSVATFSFSRALNEENYSIDIQGAWKNNIDKMNKAFDRATGDYNAFWDERNYLTNIDKMKASVLIVAGLNDWNVKPKHFDQLWRACEKYNVTHKMILSQGPHFPIYNLDGLNFLTKVNIWLDHWLYNIDNEWDSIPNVTIQSNRDLSWEYFDSWPVNNTSPCRFYFAAGAAHKTGRLSNKALTAVETFKDTYLPNGHRSVSKENIEDWTNLIVGADNPGAAVPDRLLYMSDALSGEVRLSGTTKITVNVAVDKGKGTLSAMLIDYGKDARPLFIGSPFVEIKAKNGIDYGGRGGFTDIIKFKMDAPTDYKVVTRGFVDVQNPNPSGKIYFEASDTNYVPEYYYQTVAIKPSKNYSYTFCMEPMDYTFKRGHRIGVIIYSSDAEYSIIPSDTTTFTLNLGESSYIELPIKDPGIVAVK